MYLFSSVQSHVNLESQITNQVYAQRFYLQAVPTIKGDFPMETQVGSYTSAGETKRFMYCAGSPIHI